MYKRLLLLLALLAAGLLVACEQDQDAAATQEPAQPYVSYESEELGLVLEYPEGWVAHTGFNGLTIASDQLVIDSNSLSEIGDEAFVTIIPGELALFEMQTQETFAADQPQAVLQKYRSLLEDEGQVYTVVEPLTTTTVNGENLATMVLSSPVEGETLLTLLGVVINDDFMALVSAGALEETFESARPTLERVVSSIVVTPPGGGGP
ncbi:MAG TPA: hypothetical protein VK879_02210 [Candidatus Sulfomarinibacteraceae bacterium]|nr:hypothetical protein [Candidatus Sulfomarinibacteraceae bacterium]